MTARRQKRFALLISSLMATLSITAAAQAPNTAPQVHPLAFVATAAACVHNEPMNTPAEWYPLLQRAQIWSLIYGTSVAESFAKKPAERPATCAADMKRLAAELSKAEATIFAPGWRKGRVSPSAGSLMKLDPAYTAGWCVAVARVLGQTARQWPSDIGLDNRSELGRAQIASLLAELGGIVLVMDDWEQTSTWTQATKGKPLDYTFLSRRASDDYESFYWLHRDDETEKAVLRAAKVAFSGEGGQAAPDVLVNRLRLNVELGTCRAATQAATFRLNDQ